MGKRETESNGQIISNDPNTQVGTTIVGGQPPGKTRRSVSDLPIGVEKVLCGAAADEGFRIAFFKNRLAAVKDYGFDLSESEKAMIKLIPEKQIRATIESMDLSPQNLERRSFVRAVAAGVVTLSAGETVSGCDIGTTGISPDWPDGSGPDANKKDMSVDKGAQDAQVDMPPATKGIRPDIPDAQEPTNHDGNAEDILLPDIIDGIRPDWPDGSS